MTEHWKDTALPRALTDLFSDAADLFQKELRLARVEMQERLATVLGGSACVMAALVLGGIAVLVLVEGIVFAIAARGVPAHWACVIVAAALALIAIAVFFWGKASLDSGLLPRRALAETRKDIQVVKEQLS
jgi:uncharacterized membrane protein YqjE